MTTPRKYPTLAEFEDLKEAVARIEARLSSKPERSSVIVDAVEACERIGIVDAYGTPVAVGDRILQGHPARRVRGRELRHRRGHAPAGLRGDEKGHGVKPWPQTIAGGNPWQERPPSKRKDITWNRKQRRAQGLPARSSMICRDTMPS